MAYLRDKMPDITANSNKKPAIVESRTTDRFEVQVPTIITSTCTIQGTLSLGTIQDLLLKINQLEERIRVLESK